MGPESEFHSVSYLRSNFRRLEHLAQLGLPLAGKTVLEIGAGIGDLTSFFLDRDCTVTSTEAQAVNVEAFRRRYSEEQLWAAERLRILQCRIDQLRECGVEPHEVVMCYGVLNQLGTPEEALEALADFCRGFLLLELGVDSGENRDDDAVRLARQDPFSFGGSVDGGACLPTRRWVYERLKRRFEHVYVTLLQPDYDRFRVYWKRPASGRTQHRVVFVASRTPLRNPMLVEGIPQLQYRRLPWVGEMPLPAGAEFLESVHGPMLVPRNGTLPRIDSADLDFLLGYVREGDDMCDVGAATGFFTLPFALAAGEAGSVLAVESRPEYLAALEENVRSRALRTVRCVADASDEQLRAARVIRIDDVARLERMLRSNRPERGPAALVPNTSAANDLFDALQYTVKRSPSGAYLAGQP